MKTVTQEEVKVRGKGYGTGYVRYEKFNGEWKPITVPELRKLEHSGVVIWMNP